MILLALALAVAQNPTDTDPVVRSDDGPVRGQSLANGGAVFRGIRFAAPPVGPLRWRAPTRPARWTRPADATVPHAACPQRVYGDWNRAAAAHGAEDCLFLDIRTPALRQRAKLPVLVWIHGGGNRAGSGSGTVESRITDQGIVLVSLQYRLGALGFLSHPALSREQGGHSGNYGLLDQQAALWWIRRNIGAFGGDPRRVTIAGESAGAQDVALHQLSPGSHGLFAQAIQESGTAGFGVAPRTLAQNERLGTMIATAAGAGKDAGADMLRALPLDRILAAQEQVDVPDLDDDSFIWLQAVVDGRVLGDTPAQLLNTGRVNAVPLIVGVNAKELPLHGGLPAARDIVRREFGTNAKSALALYGLDPDGTPVADPRLGDATLQLATDVTFRCPTVAISKALTHNGAPVWQYQFDYAPPGGTVSHSSEIDYVFNPPKPGAPPLQSYWINFVKTGNPNGRDRTKPRWTPYTLATRDYIAFDQTGPIARRDLRGEVCRLRDVP